MMKVYVAGALADADTVRSIQAIVVSSGHSITLDWTRGSDAELSDYEANPSLSSRVAREDLEAVLEADAVIVVATKHPGRGMYVELGAALAHASLGVLKHVVVIGQGQDSVFYFHPAVRRFPSVEEWLRTLELPG